MSTRPDPTGTTPEDPAASPTIVVIVVDRSGSMQQLRGPVVEGLNQLVGGLDADTRVTIIQFDSEDPFEVLVDGIPAPEVLPIAYDQYEPRGGTPLFDAVGRAIARAAGQAEAVKVLTGTAPTVVLGILTDGFENASCELTAEQVRTLIDHYRQEGWEITYAGIGLGDEAFAEAARIGIERRSTASYGRSGVGTRAAFMTMATSVDEARRRRRRGGAR